MKYFVNSKATTSAGTEIFTFDINSDAPLTVGQVKTVAREKYKEKTFSSEKVKVAGVDREDTFEIPRGSKVEWISITELSTSPRISRAQLTDK